HAAATYSIPGQRLCPLPPGVDSDCGESRRAFRQLRPLPASAGEQRFCRFRGVSAHLRDVLIIDPSVGLLYAHAERCVRFPTEVSLNQGVIAVTAVYALWRTQIVLTLQLNTRDLLDDVDELVHGHSLARTQIDRLFDVRVHNQPDTLDAVVDKHKASHLLAA